MLERDPVNELLECGHDVGPSNDYEGRSPRPFDPLYPYEPDEAYPPPGSPIGLFADIARRQRARRLRELQAQEREARRLMRMLRYVMSDQPADALPAIVSLRRHLEDAELRAVRLARSYGWPQGSIATALDVSRQAIHKRFVADPGGPGGEAVFRYRRRRRPGPRPHVLPGIRRSLAELIEEMDPEYDPVEGED